MEKVSSLLASVLNRRGLTVHAEGSLAVYRASAWIETQFPAISGFIHVRNVKDGELLISCDNAIAMQECRFAESALLAELKRGGSCGVIRSIRVERV